MLLSCREKKNTLDLARNGIFNTNDVIATLSTMTVLQRNQSVFREKKIKIIINNNNKKELLI